MVGSFNQLMGGDGGGGDGGGVGGELGGGLMRHSMLHARYMFKQFVVVQKKLGLSLRPQLGTPVRPKVMYHALGSEPLFRRVVMA